MKFEHVVITGGMGFIGYHLALKLRQLDAYKQLTIIDVSNEHHQPDMRPLLADKNVIHHQQSILAADCFDSITPAADLIIHAAGFLGIEQVAQHSRRTLDINITGTRNCLEFAARQADLKRFLVFSTSEVYGPDANALTEDQPMVIPSNGRRWCYAASKVATEQYTKAYARECAIPYSIIRPFNIYGPYRRGSNAMSRFIGAARQGAPLCIVGDGSQCRAWCYIDDFVAGVLSILASQDACNETFNLGNPQTLCTIYDLAKLIVFTTGSSSVIEVNGQQSDDVRNRCPLIDKARGSLKYAPAISLPEGIHRTLAWLNACDQAALGLTAQTQASPCSP